MQNAPHSNLGNELSSSITFNSGLSANEFLDIYRAILKHKFGILSFVLVVMVLVTTILQLLVPIYQSNAKLMIESKNAKVVDMAEIFDIASTKEYFNTQVQIIKSRENILTTIRALKLWDYPEFDPRGKSKNSNTIDSIKSVLGFHETAKDAFTQEELENAIIPAFLSKLKVSPKRLTQIVDISFESESPELSQMIANQVPKSYLENDRLLKFKTINEINGWLNHQLEGLRMNLVNAENALQKYKEDKGVVDINGSVQTIAAQQIGDLSQQLTSARLKKAELQSAISQIRKISNDDYSSVPAVMRSDSVSTSRAKESKAESRLSEIKARYGIDHPKFPAALAELNSAKLETTTQMKLVVSSLKREYEIATSTVSTLSRTLNNLKSSLQKSNSYGTKLNELERNVASNKQIYETFLNRAKQTSNTNEFQNAVGKVVESATLGRKIKPKKSTILAIALTLSTLISVVAAIWYEKLDNTIKGTDSVEQKLGVPVLTSLPLVEGKESASDVANCILKQSHSLFAEGIRTATTGISLSNLSGENRVILVTSSVASEGKTSFCTNLAISLSSSKKVLLIDGDFRRPSIGKVLGLSESKLGLTNFLISKTPIKSVLQVVPNTNLTVLPVGLIPPAPLDLIGSERFKLLMVSLRDYYDFVVIDSPPLGLVSDALALMQHADASVYVVKSMDTPVPLIRKGIKQLLALQKILLGVVVNQLDFKKSEQYYGEYSAYGKYGYKSYGYEPEDDNHDDVKTTTKAL